MKKLTILAAIVSLGSLGSCSNDPNVRSGQYGGAAIGGLAGGLITNSWGGAAAGAAVGGLIGGEVKRSR